jgi:P-type E1-E2 ATPase
MIPGEGITALVEGKQLLAGNEKMFTTHQISFSDIIKEEVKTYLNEGSTVIYVAIDGKFAGYVVLSDTIREESKQLAKNLTKIGVTPVLLTGDNENSANTIGKRLGISEIHASCLPEDKLRFIEDYQKNSADVCMIGDGINDAPALKKANVGIAMGGVGSDIAVDAADIALVDDEVKELPHLFALSKRMMTTIRCNLTFSMGLNFLAIILAMTGILNPVVGALVHNAGSVLVILNSFCILNYKSETQIRDSIELRLEVHQNQLS